MAKQLDFNNCATFDLNREEWLKVMDIIHALNEDSLSAGDMQVNSHHLFIATMIMNMEVMGFNTSTCGVVQTRPEAGALIRLPTIREEFEFIVYGEAK